MAQKIRLIGEGNFNIAVDDHTLASQPRIDARVYGPVDKIFFLIGYLLDIVHSLVYINLASAASAYTTAIVL